MPGLIITIPIHEAGFVDTLIILLS